ncbi:hypothetical protein [Actinomadura geliboluensis]|uniref:hypothetical protein n=1 Tax=Actinomadura geliboluensis TaxID=882440 RepID=UPI00197AF3A9|nr:hypothetical protein [Actinomadura geliboluensis]
MALAFFRGDVAGTLADRAETVRRLPLPRHLTEYGELLESAGRRDEAGRQYAVAAAWTRIAEANGVAADLETALAEADYGDPKTALQAARAEYERRCPGRGMRQCSVHAADTPAWALHVNGRDAEALRYARQATATGYRSALFRFHLGAIEKAAGKRAAARRNLAAALRLNSRFSPLWAPRARAALDDPRRRTVIAAVLAAGLLAAHPLGNFSVNRYDGLVAAPHELRVDHVEDLAEIPRRADHPRAGHRRRAGRLGCRRCASNAASPRPPGPGRSPSRSVGRTAGPAGGRSPRGATG